MLIGVDASRITRPRRTGTENYSLHLLRELLSRDTENAYRLYASMPISAELIQPRSSTATRLIRLPRLWTQVGLSREMLTNPPDVLFVPSHVLPLVTPRASVVVVHDVGHRVFPRAHGLTEWLYAEWAIRRHVRIASRVLTVSETTKRDLVHLYHADPAHVDVAYPAVDRRFAPASGDAIAAVKARYGLADRYVLHLGTIKPRKNLARLVHAFAAADIPSDVQLALGGTTTVGAASLERAIRETRLEERVKRLAYVPDADLAALYSGAAAVAIVSLYEGFGMPALEALACGAPLVAGNRGSLPEIAGGAAVMVDPLSLESIRNGLQTVLRDGHLREALRARGLDRARSFSWANAADVTRRALEMASGVTAGTRPLSRSPFAAS